MQPNPNNPHRRNLSAHSYLDSPLTVFGRIGLLLGALGTGFLLYELGGGFPPPAWMSIWSVLQGGLPPVHFLQLLIQSFILLVAWLLLLLVVLQVARPRRISQGGRETPAELALPSPRATTQLSEQQVGATPIVQRIIGASSTEASYQHPWKGTSALSHALLPVSSSTSAISIQEEHQDEVGSRPALSHVNESKQFPQPSERETHGETAGTITSSPVQPLIEREGQERHEEANALAVTASGTQMVSSPDGVVKELHQNTSRGDASPHSFRIVQTLSGETDQEEIVINGWSLCHPGIQRTQEPLEDFLLVVDGLRTQVTPHEPFVLFVLADGNLITSRESTTEPEGSLSRRTARWFGEIILSTLQSADSLEPETVLRRLSEAMQQVNTRLYQYNQREHTSELVTMTVLLILGTEAYLASVGDNRAYLYRLKRSRQATDEGLFQITNDHSSTATQLEQGVLTPDDLFKLPKSDHVYRALGQRAALNTVDVFSITLSKGDVLALCSDGLWKVVREATLLQIIEHLLQPPVSSPALLCSALVQAALEAGGHDHTSIMVVQIEISEKLPPTE